MESNLLEISARQWLIMENKHVLLKNEVFRYSMYICFSCM